METKKDFIVALSHGFFRILNKHARLEALPVHFDNGQNVTHRELHFIQVIGENKTINIKETGDVFGVTKSAASQMVSKLEKKGFLKKEPALHNNKELQLTLTEFGWEAFRLHEVFHGRQVSELINRLEVFSLEQISTISVLLGIIEDVINDRLSEKFP